MASNSSDQPSNLVAKKKQDPDACVCAEINVQLTCYASKCKNLAGNILFNRAFVRERAAVQLLRTAFPGMKVVSTNPIIANKSFSGSMSELGTFQITRPLTEDDKEDEVVEGDDDEVVARKKASREEKTKRDWARLNRVGVYIGQLVESKEDGEIKLSMTFEPKSKGKRRLVARGGDGVFSNIVEIADDDT